MTRHQPDPIIYTAVATCKYQWHRHDENKKNDDYQNLKRNQGNANLILPWPGFQF